MEKLQLIKEISINCLSLQEIEDRILCCVV